MKSQKTIKEAKDNIKKTAKKNVNPVVAGAAGAAVGAGIGIATAVAMKDKKNRKKVGQVVNEVRKQAVEYMETVKKSGAIERGKQVVKDSVVMATKEAQKRGNKMIEKSTRKLSQTKRTNNHQRGSVASN